MTLLQLALMAFVAVAVVLAPRRYWPAVLITVAFFPVTLGSVGGVQQLLVSEWLIPVLFVPTILDMLRTRRAPVRRGALFLAAVLLVFCLTAFANAIRVSDGLVDYPRALWYVPVGVALFFELAWYGGRMLDAGVSLRPMFWYFAALASVVAAARVIGYYADLPLPGLGGVFQYGGQTPVGLGAPSDRIGGLAETVSLGLPALGGLLYCGARAKSAGVLLAWMCVVVALSGGRSLFAGVLVASVALVLLLVRARRERVLLGLAITAAGVVLAVAALHASPLFERQLARLTLVRGGIAVQDPVRIRVWDIMWQQFLNHPVIGKGVGVGVVNPLSVSDAFVAEQVKLGGHGAYHALAGNFGLVGICFVATALGAATIGSTWCLRHRRRLGAVRGDRDMVLVLVLLGAVIRALTYIAGGNGYSDMGLYALCGLFAASLPPSTAAHD